MSLLKAENSKKWINFLIAIAGIVVGFILIRFLGQMGEWLDLESKIPSYLVLCQAVGVIAGISFFAFIYKNERAMGYMDEVYGELIKVVWPDKDSTIKLTVGIIIGIGITSAVFLLVDFIFNEVINLIYKI